MSQTSIGVLRYIYAFWLLPALSLLQLYWNYQTFKSSQSLNERWDRIEHLNREELQSKDTSKLMAALVASKATDSDSPLGHSISLPMQRNILLGLLSVLGLRVLWSSAQKYLETYQRQGVPSDLHHMINRADRTSPSPRYRPPKKRQSRHPRRTPPGQANASR